MPQNIQIDINPVWFESAIDDCDHGPILAISPEIYSDICDDVNEKKDKIFLERGYRKIENFEYGAIVELRKKPLMEQSIIIYWK